MVTAELCPNGVSDCSGGHTACPDANWAVDCHGGHCTCTHKSKLWWH